MQAPDKLCRNLSSNLVPVPVARSAASGRRDLVLERLVVEKTPFDRRAFRTLEFVLVICVVVKADDAALLTDPVDDLASWQNLVLTGRALGDCEFDLFITSVGNRGC
jgi:hypothetical protein